MNNEEKILQILEQMNGRLNSMDSRFDAMDSRFDALDSRVDSMESTIGRLDKSVARLEQLPHQIQLLAEAQKQTNDKLDHLQKTVDDMAPTVTALDVLHQMRPHNS